MTKTLDLLRRFPVLRELSESELGELADIAEEVTLARGDYLFREGDPGDSLYLLEEGILVVERSIDAEAGVRKDLAIFAALSLVGEMALADDSPRSASVRAEIPCHLHRIPSDRFQAFVEKDPAAAYKIFRALFTEASQRLRTTNEQLVAIYEVGRYVAAASDPSSVASLVARSLLSRLEASCLIVALYEEPTNQLRIVHAAGEKAEHLVDLMIPLEEGLIAQAFDQKKPLLVERLLGATEAWESSSMLLIPLVIRDQARGLLMVGERRSQTPHPIASLSMATALVNISAPMLCEAFARH